MDAILAILGSTGTGEWDHVFHRLTLLYSLQCKLAQRTAKQARVSGQSYHPVKLASNTHQLSKRRDRKLPVIARSARTEVY